MTREIGEKERTERKERGRIGDRKEMRKQK
jgi:hypothetical protein